LTTCDKQVHAKFWMLLPRIELDIQSCFQDQRCQEKRNDSTEQTVAPGSKWFVCLTKLGKAPAHRGSASGHPRARVSHFPNEEVAGK
jgi:hypothetical protein